MEDFVIIDGNSLINRAFYALPPLSNSRGEFSNAVYGFTNILIKTILEKKPKYLAVAFDFGKKTFRNKLFPDYKLGRKKTPDELVSQFPILKKLLKSMNIKFIEIEGVEADDIIGTLTKKFNVNNKIITGDKDCLQLINQNTEVWLTKKGISEIKLMNAQTLKEEMGLEPYQIIELKSLMGDSSDNIPGVLGVGEKTATQLLNSYKTLDGVYQNLDLIKGKVQEKLKNDKDCAFLSKELATIKTDLDLKVNLEDFSYKFPFDKQVFNFFKEYEFNSLLRKPELFDNVEFDQSFEKYNANRIEITEMEMLFNQIKHIKRSKKFAFELNNQTFNFAYDKNCEFFLNVQSNLLGSNVDISNVLSELKSIFEDPTIEKYAFDLKTLMHSLLNFGVSLKGIKFDALLGFYLLSAGEREANRQNLLTAFGLDSKYTAINLFYLFDMMSIKLLENNLLDLYQKIELPLIEVLFDMEKTGFKIDPKVLENLSIRYTAETEEMAKTIKKLAGEDFNVNSPKQLSDILFKKLGLVCYNNKKNSTSIEHLEEMYDLHPIIPAIIRYRKIQKILTTYVESYKSIFSPKDNLIHTIFNQTLTATGRLSSSEPNLQNIPIRDDEGRSLRKMFVSRHPEGVLICADYSQIELRLLAHLSKDPVLTKAFNNNIDIHSLTASEVFGVEIQKVTPLMRRTAKEVNFGIIYGISDYGLSQNIGCSRKQAKIYIEQYFKKYPNVKSYVNSCIEKAKATTYAHSIFGRRRKINELFSANYATRNFGERVAMNMPLQGSASDIIKLAMVKVFEAINKNNLKSKLILQVHDELIIDAVKSEITQVVQILRENMENAIKLSVPLTVGINTGKSWFDC